jgi:hypothetical protein
MSYGSWITVSTSSSSGGATGTVTYSVAPNPDGGTRTGTIQFAGQTFTVSQTAAACSFSLNAYGIAFNGSGGSGTVAGTESAQGCAAPVVGTTQPSIVSLGTLTGPVLDLWDLPFTVNPFQSVTTAIRSAQITFGGKSVVVKQTSW